jgi:tetratricopeptide (TPR) repeat protein
LFMVNAVDYLLASAAAGESLRRPFEAVLAYVPERIQQVIEKQLDRLSADEQQTLEVASVAGMEFSTAAIAAAIDLPVSEVEGCCTRLARREQFIRGEGAAEWPDGTVASRFGFLHALYRDVLYERVPAGQRVSFHRRIAERQEAAYGDRVAEIATVLAHHYEGCGDKSQAFKFLELAGEQAARRAAFGEAIGLFSSALRLLGQQPDLPDRTHKEVSLQVALGTSWQASKGHGASEAELAFDRARELCEPSGQTPVLFRSLAGLWAVYQVQAKFKAAGELGTRLLTLADSLAQPLFRLSAHRTVGTTLLWQGEFGTARAHLERALALYNPEKRKTHGFRAVQDPGVDCLCFSSLALWFLGYPDQARKRMLDATTLAGQLGHKFTEAYALHHAAELNLMLRDIPAARESAEAAFAICCEHGFPFFQAAALNIRGWALAAAKDGDEGVVQIRQSLELYRTTGSEINWPHMLHRLSEAYSWTGRHQAGLETLSEALAIAERTGERWWESDIIRLKGALTLQAKIRCPKSKLRAEAEGYFRQAVEVARQQNARSFELRSTTSLARLLHATGRRVEARAMLAEIYGWFTEGFDTADLKEARALLDELRGY